MKKISTIFVISLLCVSAFSILTPKVMGWASSVPSALHGDMAYDALAETGWSDSDRTEIKKYACEEIYTDYYHRVHVYQDILHTYHTELDRLLPLPPLGPVCKCSKQGLYGGAEDGAYQYIQWARSNYTNGNVAEARKCLGYAIHFIQDSVCPPHVFPFQDKGALSGTAAPDFEAWTAMPGRYRDDWQSWVTGAEIQPIESAADLRSKLRVAAARVWTEFSSLSSGFGYVRHDGEQIGDLSGLFAALHGWNMPMDGIGWCIERAASLVKGAAAWVIGGSIAIMDFENGVDQAPIRSTIPGMAFTTTMGYDWVYGDIRTGGYNVYPYGSRSYECHGNFFAWLGPNQGSGRIDFTGATAKSISMLTSTGSGIYLEAYDSSGILLASDYAGPNTNTRTMAEIKVTGSNIAYVIVHDTGNYWLIDDLRVQDLLRETHALQPPGSSSVFQTLDTINQGETSVYEFTTDRQQTLSLFLNWEGSRFGIQFIKPDGAIFAEVESDDPPIRITVPNAEIGTWTAIVTALETPYDDYPFALDVASIDSAPPQVVVVTPTSTDPPAALQDGVTLEAIVTDPSGVDWVTFSIREPDGEQGTLIDPTFESMSATQADEDTWQIPNFNTNQPLLPDGYYVLIARASDTLGNEGFVTVRFSIRNWAAIQLLPSTPNSKTGRTMPIKFSIRVKASVDPAQPFIYNEELTIKIYKIATPSNILLQTSIFGSGSKNYRIDAGKLYITNFKTLSTPATYLVNIYRKDVLVGSFRFSTVK